MSHDPSFPNCTQFNAWQYEVPEGRFWSWACSCGRTLATHGSDPLTIRSMDDAVADSTAAHSGSRPEGGDSDG